MKQINEKGVKEILAIRSCAWP